MQIRTIALSTAIIVLAAKPTSFAEELPQPESPAAQFSNIEFILLKVQLDIQTARNSYQREAQRRQALEADVKRLRREQEQTQQESDALKRNQELLETQLHELEQQLRTAHEDAASGQRALNEAHGQLAALRAEKQHLLTALSEIRKQAQGVEHRLAAEQRAAAQALLDRERQLAMVEDQLQQLQHRHADLMRNSERLQAKVDDLQRQLQEAEQTSADSQRALEEAHARSRALTTEKDQAATALSEARSQIQALMNQLAAEQAKVTALEADRQAAVAAMNQAHEESLARIENQAGQLEAEKSRSEALAKRLTERDQEIGMLRQEWEILTQRVAAVSTQLDEANKRIADLTRELSVVAERAIVAEEERDHLASQVTEQLAVISRAEQELEKLRQGMPQTPQGQQVQTSRQDAVGALHEADIQRVAKMYDTFTKAFGAEIGKGDVAVQQLGDRLTITVLDRILFHPGQAKLKPEGLTVLKRLSGLLRGMAKTGIRVEGHTDNVPIGQKLRAQFSTNWELSTARATTVVRYLVEEGGVEAPHLSAAGYADTRPVASNETAEGRALNRRLEITLIPENATFVASRIQP